MFTKVAENALCWFECITEPCDTKNSWYTKKFQACVGSFNQTPKLIPCVHSSWANYDLHMAPQVEVSRCETRQLQRPLNQSVLCVNVGSGNPKNCFMLRIKWAGALRIKWAGAPSCINHSLFHPPVVEVILLLKNVNMRPLRVAVACKVLLGD
jgi:hypothetical protein